MVQRNITRPSILGTIICTWLSLELKDKDILSGKKNGFRKIRGGLKLNKTHYTLHGILKKLEKIY